MGRKKIQDLDRHLVKCYFNQQATPIYFNWNIWTDQHKLIIEGEAAIFLSLDDVYYINYYKR